MTTILSDALCDRIAVLVGERDRARDVAVQLEQQIARALDEHYDIGGVCCSCVGFLNDIPQSWPCRTARALGDES